MYSLVATDEYSLLLTGMHAEAKVVVKYTHIHAHAHDNLVTNSIHTGRKKSEKRIGLEGRLKELRRLGLHTSRGLRSAGSLAYLPLDFFKNLVAIF